MRRGPDSNNAEWYEGVYNETVANESVKSGTLAHAKAMRSEDDPDVLVSDVQASRAYLKQCMMNMSTSELSAKPFAELAALWARGALGAARYRSKGGSKRRRAGATARSRAELDPEESEE
jgi:hypothetical protein